MRTKAVIRLRFTSKKQLSTLFSALTPEVNTQISNRAKATLTKEGNILILKVEAKDATALRATLNAYLRWIDSTIKVLEVVEHIS
jgi:KEOPS complex subunit Pcc1